MQGAVWACQTVRVLYEAVCAYRALDGSSLFADAGSSAGRVVQETIIPTIATLSRYCPVRLDEVLSSDIILSLGLKPTSLCNNLIESDHLFGSLPSK